MRASLFGVVGVLVLGACGGGDGAIDGGGGDGSSSADGSLPDGATVPDGAMPPDGATLPDGSTPPDGGMPDAGAECAAPADCMAAYGAPPCGSWECTSGSCNVVCAGCTDADLDGYGAGSGCAGPDCDDADDTVLSSAVRSCYSGPPGTDGVGTCLAGTETCTAGVEYDGP